MNPLDRVPAIPAIPKQSGLANVPGLRRLWLIEARHVLGVIDPRTVPGVMMTGWQLTNVGLSLGEDAVLHSLVFPAERGDYEQKPVVTVQGVSYQHTLMLTVPRDHTTTALVMQRMINRRWLAIAQDANGQRKVIGTVKQPLRFLGSQKTSPNGFVFTWSGETGQPAYFFSDDGLLNFSNPDAEFSYGFSDEFYT